MSKIDIGVGDEFPLDEPQDDRRAWHRGHRHHHGRHHRHHHHRHHGFGRLPVLLVIAGFIALAVNHQLTASIAYGMIGVGAGLLVLMFLVHAIWHWRHHRGMRNTPSQVA
ncbi:MAG TPA: hypothetical protein VFQ52_09320 [Rhizomicrobium sp.]|jgi:hypothetical protein|nr:hypothetical protein [Rhizomicrobium sp.]